MCVVRVVHMFIINITLAYINHVNMLCMYDIDLCYVVHVLSELRMWVCTHSMYTISTQSFDTVLVLHVVYTHT